MDLIGHCVAACKSGVFEEDDVFGPGAVSLMLPNLFHCHDWGYTHLWVIDGFSWSLQPIAARMRAHIIADWVIHYGDEQSTTKQKVGWAYQHMARANSDAAGFFEGARRRGLLRSDARDPSCWTTRQELDYAHSMTEYALDFILCDQMSSSSFVELRRYLVELSDPESLAGWRQVARSMDIHTDQPQNIIKSTFESLGYDAANAERPEDFAVAAAIRKCRFHSGEESVLYMQDYLAGLAADMSTDSCEALLKRISSVIAEPKLIYTGPWICGNSRPSWPAGIA